MTVARNDFAPRLGRAIDLDEDYYREAKEELHDRLPTPPELIAEEQARADELAESVACPECFAGVDQPCHGSSGPHFARRERYART